MNAQSEGSPFASFPPITESSDSLVTFLSDAILPPSALPSTSTSSSSLTRPGANTFTVITVRQNKSFTHTDNDALKSSLSSKSQRSRDSLRDDLDMDVQDYLVRRHASRRRYESALEDWQQTSLPHRLHREMLLRLLAESHYYGREQHASGRAFALERALRRRREVAAKSQKTPSPPHSSTPAGLSSSDAALQLPPVSGGDPHALSMSAWVSFASMRSASNSVSCRSLASSLSASDRLECISDAVQPQAETLMQIRTSAAAPSSPSDALPPGANSTSLSRRLAALDNIWESRQRTIIAVYHIIMACFSKSEALRRKRQDPEYDPYGESLKAVADARLFTPLWVTHEMASSSTSKK